MDIKNDILKIGKQAKNSRSKLISDTLYHKKIPQSGWDEMTIEHFLADLASLDSNNYLSHARVGEREGRVFSGIVQRRHFRMTHGIGKSGDLNEWQPKATGSSSLHELANSLALHAIQLSGIKNAKSCFIAPCSTGMSLTFCLLQIRRLKPKASHVIWSRIDQKSCLKCILTAGYQPIIIELQQIGECDQLGTDLLAMENSLTQIGPENVACVLTTTSCFAPRIPDDVINVAKMCKKYNVFHVVNNAYGLQCDSICNKINEASLVGRIDAFVQSTDKNFMVPVGGAIIAGFDKIFIDSIAKIYPGRASSSASVDLLITLLSMGVEGYCSLRNDRKAKFDDFRAKLTSLASEHSERLLNTPKNPISLAISLEKLDKYLQPDEITELGSMLFTRQCSGARVVVKAQTKIVENFEFHGWMSHCASYKCSYLNVAAAIGIESKDIDRFIKILSECFLKMSLKIKN